MKNANANANGNEMHNAFCISGQSWVRKVKRKTQMNINALENSQNAMQRNIPT